MYGPPHLNLTTKQVEKLDILLRKAYKNALGLPEYAATKRLLEFGVHNTFEQLANTQIRAQIRRLGGTDSGRWLLDKLGLANPNAASLRQQIELDDHIRAGVRTSRIPRNMNQSRDAERRVARSEALARTWDSRPGTLTGVATSAVATSDGSKIVTKASFRVSCATKAEEVAIALAVTCNPKATIISDSQGAVRHFAAGSVGEVAAGLLRRHPPQVAQIVWSPGHMGHPGNEVAHATARDSLPSRDSIPASGVEDWWSFSKCLLDIRLARKRFPAPDKSLSKEGEHILQRQQTNTFLTPDKLHTWYPDRYTSAACPWCGWQKADTYHMVWACEKNEKPSQCEASEEEWYAALASEDPVQQQLLIRRAKAAQASGVLE
ncbi:hypothetical protein HPB47_017919 [Ixodes persulcatus]|uniref:Uncharacterized protein n=1 Tax=Ixodes persulcatus TaxID=34615 RepID=A0AC60QP08_IXOPE|nr:hypothetical protein HPB47_017919 [Ixodes persulcatus]